MKKLIIIITGLVLLLSCNRETKNAKDITIKGDIIKINGQKIYTYEINGCEYLGYLDINYYNANFLTHSGMCSNPIHNQEKEIIHDTIYVIKDRN